MAEHQENSIKLLLASSWENRHSFDSSESRSEAFHGDEEFYEEIKAPRFVDFTAPDHYCPDDRYWFCDRVGCDQKHLEEMDSEAIFKKFVRRAMAARSPNVIRLRKILDASRKCPFSAPAKPSKPRVSGMALISTFSKKANNEKEKVDRPLSKPRLTPVGRTRPVSAKYLTTPRIKKSAQVEDSFRSVRNPKPDGMEVSNTRIVAKALVFHSPEKKVVASSDKKIILGKSNKSKIRGKSSEQQSSKSEGSCENKEQPTAQKAAKEFELPNPKNVQENNSGDGKELIRAVTPNKSSGREGDDAQHVYNEEDGDNKENAAAPDENRFETYENPKQKGRKIFALQEQSGRRVGKKVPEAQDNRGLKEGLISSSPVVKLKKSKATNPKPFRLRTDERGILKERRAEHVVPQSESATSGALTGNLQMKQGNDIQGVKIPKGQERSKPTATVMPESKKHSDRKPINGFSESTAMQRLEKFRKNSSPLQKGSCRPQSFVPCQKLGAIQENSPKVLAKRSVKTDEPQGEDAAASQSSSLAAKPNFQRTHVPRKPKCALL